MPSSRFGTTSAGTLEGKKKAIQRFFAYIASDNPWFTDYYLKYFEIHQEIGKLTDELKHLSQGLQQTNHQPPSYFKSIHKGVETFKYCYNKTLKRNPRVEGDLTLLINIDVKGIIKSVGIMTEEIDDAGLKSCLVKSTKQLRFHPSDKQKQTILYVPLRFE